MTRRTRQLAVQHATIRKWRILKADVKAAFLQGEGSEEARIFAVPVPELFRALHLPEGQAVQATASSMLPQAGFNCPIQDLAFFGF